MITKVHKNGDCQILRWVEKENVLINCIIKVFYVSELVINKMPRPLASTHLIHYYVRLGHKLFDIITTCFNKFIPPRAVFTDYFDFLTCVKIIAFMSEMELRALSDKTLSDFVAALIVPSWTQNWVNQIHSSPQITFSLLSLTAARINILIQGMVKMHF